MANRFALALPDPVGAFRQGRRQAIEDTEVNAQRERANRFRQLSGEAYAAGTPMQRQQVLAQAASVDPEGAMALDRQMGSNEERGRKRLSVWAQRLDSIPEENNSARMWMYQQMLPEMRQLGLDPPDEYTPQIGEQMIRALTQDQGSQPAELQNFNAMTQGLPPEDVEQARRIALGLKERAASGGFGFRTVTLPDGRETLVVTDRRNGQVRQATAAEVQSFMGAGAAPSQSSGSPGGPAFVGPTPGQIEADKAQAKAGVELATAPEIARQTQTATVTAKTGAERQAGFITEGLSASDSMPVINRAIELLESVPTGGINAAKLAATNFFGITGADEAELSNNLGKAVLSQLRATFGAAFTEREGARLDSIEANFGKSTAGNKRLLQQTKQIVERAARRGIDAARASGDEFSAQEIERGLRTTPSMGSQRPASAARAAPAADGWSIVEE